MCDTVTVVETSSAGMRGRSVDLLTTFVDTISYNGASGLGVHFDHVCLSFLRSVENIYW